MKPILSLIKWLCRKFTRDQLLEIIDELIKVLNNEYDNIKPKDNFKEKHPNYRDFNTDPLMPLDAAEIVKPKKT